MEKKKNNSQMILMLSGIGLIILAVVLILVFLMRGEEKTSGGVTDYSSLGSVTCKAENYRYPLFSYDGAIKTETKMSAIFDGEEMESISLSQTIYYGSADLIEQAEANIHAAMNIDFGKNGFSPDAFGATYVMLPDALKFSLYAKADAIDEKGSKYFLLSNTKASDIKPATLGNIYTKGNGFNCTESK